MSRSKKHTPIHGWHSSNGQKQFRSQENRAKRKKVKQVLSASYLDESIESLIPPDKEYGNEWSSPRDGKAWDNSDSWKDHGLNYNKWLKK